MAPPESKFLEKNFCFFTGLLLVATIFLFASAFMITDYKGVGNVILFHYDGNVNGWDDMEWNERVTHIAARAQTKWRTDRDFHGELKCRNISGPPCAGWVEMMVPVFSRASWRCVWHMIQNDLVIAWGLDYQLGYCAQGNRTENIGVVDAEYIIHRGEPILGSTPQDPKKVDPHHDGRGQFRQKAFAELQEFKSRWSKAIQGDKTWNDPYSARHK